jgi:L-iditol 2-dehydrogenase
MMHMLELIDIHVGDTVAVTGAGPIGMLAAPSRRHRARGRVFVADKLGYRLKNGAIDGRRRDHRHVVASLVESVLESTRQRGVDLVLECAGAAETVNAGIRMARRAARSC